MGALTTRPVLLFLALLVAFTAAASSLADGGSGSPIYSLLIMWSPGLAAISTLLLTRRSLGSIGWKPWPVRWLGIGWLIPMLYASRPTP